MAIDTSVQSEEAEDPLSCGLNVFLFNMSEDVWPFINAIAEPGLREHEIAENVALTDRELLGFWAEHPGGGIYLSPGKVSPEFTEYLESVFGRQKVKVVSTVTHTGRISIDLIREDVIGKLNLDNTKTINLKSYCASPEMYTLVKNWRDRGMKVNLPQNPEESSWKVVSHYATKSGVRELVGELMVEGEIFTHLEEAISKAVRVAMKTGVVIKTNKGHSGMGVAIFPPEVGLDKTQWEEKIRTTLAADNGYWNKFPVIIEQYVETDKAVAGGVPDVEVFVDQTGKVTPLYYCGMRVRRGVFVGVEVGDKVVPKRYMKEMETTGVKLGQEYAKAGYRGFFDVDFLLDKEGRLFVGESNIRRTGGTFAYQVAKRLIGPEFMDTHILVTRMVELKANPGSFEEVRLKLKPWLWSKDKNEGVVLVSANLLAMNKFSYLIMGKGRERVGEIEREMLKTISG